MSDASHSGTVRSLTHVGVDGWLENAMDVEFGPHEYTFKIHAEADIGPAFVLDTFACKE